MNQGKDSGLIHFRPLSGTVYLAKVWTEKPKPSDNIVYGDGPHTLYFIKNLDGLFVGAVLDMTSDLHWFVEKKYRGQGYLTHAMREAILPHLFQNRDEQIITIEKGRIGKKYFSASEGVALALGFSKVEDGRYILKKRLFRENKIMNNKINLISEERLEELKKRLNYLGRSLWVIHSEIEIKLGNPHYSDELGNLVNEIKDHVSRLEDAWWKSKNVT